ncbi:hypothetical protein BDV19DRAFT_326678 [Aspergillus venezuelensis]
MFNLHLSPPIGLSRVPILLVWAETKSAGSLTSVLACLNSNCLGMALVLVCLAANQIPIYGEGGRQHFCASSWRASGAIIRDNNHNTDRGILTTADHWQEGAKKQTRVEGSGHA